MMINIFNRLQCELESHAKKQVISIAPGFVSLFLIKRDF